MILPMVHASECQCGCVDDAMLAWHAVAQELDPVTAALARKADGLDKESGTDDFMAEELGVALALSVAWRTAGASAKEKLLSSVATSYSPYQFQATLDEVSADMDSIYELAKPEVTKNIKKTLEIGAKKAGSTLEVLKQSPSVSLTEESLLNATKYYTNKYFRETIVPAIHKSIDKAIEGTEVTPLADIQAAIAQHFKPTPYWNMVANVGASRGFHYGMLKSYEQTKVVGYRIYAIIDGKTSTICRSMNGKEFLVTEAVHQLEALANDTNPGAAKTKTPWLKASQIKDKSSTELAKMGFMFPPFHALCRTTVRQI